MTRLLLFVFILYNQDTYTHGVIFLSLSVLINDYLFELLYRRLRHLVECLISRKETYLTKGICYRQMHSPEKILILYVNMYSVYTMYYSTV